MTAGGAHPVLGLLHEHGAQRFDPVRYRYIEALARRTVPLEGEVRRVLEHRLAQAVAAYLARFEQARPAAAQALAQGLAEQLPAPEGPHPEPPEPRAPREQRQQRQQQLRQLHAAGDFKGLQRLVSEPAGPADAGPLGRLVRDIDRLAALPPEAAQEPRPASAPAPAGPATTAPAELKALRHFRSTWTRLSADRQLSRSLAQVPDNPGPLNSHLLVLRSLRLMQELSPAYLNRFLVHAEALLWLDDRSTGPVSAPGDTVHRDTDRKRKGSRGRAGPG